MLNSLITEREGWTGLFGFGSQRIARPIKLLEYKKKHSCLSANRIFCTPTVTSTRQCIFPTACVTSTPVRALTFLQRCSRGTLFFKNRQVLRPIDPRGQGHISFRRRDSITHWGSVMPLKNGTLVPPQALSTTWYLIWTGGFFIWKNELIAKYYLN